MDLKDNIEVEQGLVESVEKTKKKVDVKKKRWLIRNRNFDSGTYYFGNDSYVLKGHSFVIVEFKPQLLSAELSIVEYQGDK